MPDDPGTSPLTSAVLKNSIVSWWKIFPARMFGTKITTVTDECRIEGYQFRGRYYITNMVFKEEGQ